MSIKNAIKNLLKSKVGLKGRARLQCFDKDGNLKWDTGFMRNTIASAGKAVVAGLIGNSGSPTAFTYLAVGTSATAESASHTALQAEITDSGLARASATVALVTTTVTNDTLRLTKTFSVTGTKTIEEIGIFNAVSAGTMLGRKLTTSKAVSSGDSLQATYDIQVS